ncbi:MAG TPA: M48 family metalloprotease [Myxococcota bacterium]
MRRFLLALGIGLACAPAPPPSGPPPRRPIVLSTEYDDQRAGEEAKLEVAAALGLVRDPKVQELVDAIGRRCAAKLPAHSFDYDFRVVDQWPPNAFALPGGAVYVSRGLLVLSNSEDELANVLAHEITHAAARHAAARQTVGGGVNPFAIVFTNPAYLAAYSRDQEREADRGGQQLAAAAGYDPAGMNTFLDSLGNVEKLLAGASRLPGYFDTHPPTSERAASTATRAQHLGWTPQPGVTRDRDDYLRRLTGLVVGEDPAEGIFEKGRFLHPDLGFSLRVPDGWRFVNSPAAVGAISQSGRARVVLELAGEGSDPAVFADEFAAQRAVEIQAKIESRRVFTLNGLPAVEIRGSAPGPGGTVAGRITWIALNDRVFRLGNLVQGVGAERALALGDVFTRSFRPLAPEDRAGIRVRRLRLATAHAGESLADFSRRAGNDWDAQRTAIANGMFASARLAEGQLLKIAVLEAYETDEAPKQGAR